MSQKRKNWGPPIAQVNRNYYHPMIHTPPSGLENTVTLETRGRIPMKNIVVTQRPANQEYKPGPDFNEDLSYGNFVEMGGRKKNKRRTQKKGKTRKKRKRKTRLRKKNKRSTTV